MTSGYIERQSILGIAVIVLLLASATLYLLNNLDAERVSGTPTQADITIKLRELANAIKAENVEEIERLLDWFEKWNIQVNLDEMAGRFICAWCTKDCGPSGTIENSSCICDQCREKLNK